MKDLEDIGKPVEPGPGDCCGSGCPRCVWDIYFDNLADWEAKRAEAKASGEHEVVPALPSLPLPTATTCTSFAGAIVLKYVEDEDATDEYGVTCTSESRTPMWGQGMVRVARVTNSGSPATSATSLPLVTLDLSAPIADANRYSPGDVVEVLVPNDLDSVKALCKHFRVPMDRLCQFHVSPFVPPTCFPPWVPQRHNITIGTLFTYYIDISSSAYLRKPFFALLQKSMMPKAGSSVPTTAPSPLPTSGAMGPLDELLSDHKLLNREVQATLPSLLDILGRFASIAGSSGAQLPLAKFLEVSAPLRARKFSVVDVEDEGRRVVLCVRDVRHKRQRRSDDTCARFPGAEAPTLVEPALFDVEFRGHVARSLCLGGVTTESSTVPAPPPPPIWLRSSFGHSMIPRQYLSRPLLLFGGGSGIAPILSLLVAAGRALGTTSSSHAPAWNRWLFFGCRTPQDLQSVLGDAPTSLRTTVLSTCSRIDVSLSQLANTPTTDSVAQLDVTDGRDACQGVRRHAGHVTGVVSDEATAVREWVFGSKAAIVACGPTAFLTSVRETLTNVLYPQQAGDDASIGEQQFRLMELQGDVVFEDWNNRK